MNIVMIAVHKHGNKIIGFRILDTDSGDIKDVPKDNLREVLQREVVDVENVTLQGTRIVGSNGKLQRYPILVNGRLYGRSPLIILFELADDYYRVTNYMGEIVDIHQSEAIRYAETEGIANGKIITTEDGNKFISSINGTYKQDRLVRDKKYGRTLLNKMKVFGVREYSLDDNYHMMLNDKSVEELRVARGVLGILPNGCKGALRLREVVLPDTLEVLGESAFSGCRSLEVINIPEGVKVIPKRCFLNCTSLREIHLPNSLKIVETHAFMGCNNLKKVYCGPNPVKMEFGALPRGARRVKR